MGYYSGKLMGMQAEAVSSIPTDYILRYDFNGDVLDKSTNALNGIKTGTASYGTGRKSGTQCLDFTAGCVKTNGNLSFSVGKLTISMWIKSTQSVTAIIMELSQDYSSNFPSFALLMRTAVNIDIIDKYGDALTNNRKCTLPSGWKHVVITVDRQLGANQNFIYIDTVNQTTTYTYNGDIPYVAWASYPLHIGQRNASSLPFVGSLQDIRIYNRVLTTEEITALYNE